AAIQAVRQVLGRIDLSRALTPYPDTNPFSPTNIGSYRHDSNAANGPQLIQANLDRQALAADIYRVLRKIVGVQAIPVADQPAPTEAELMPRRWLAKLAVTLWISLTTTKLA